MDADIKICWSVDSGQRARPTVRIQVVHGEENVKTATVQLPVGLSDSPENSIVTCSKRLTTNKLKTDKCPLLNFILAMGRGKLPLTFD